MTQFNEYLNHPDREDIDRAYVANLEQRIAEFELRYNLPSIAIHDSIDAGTLAETSDVCSWIMAVDMLELART